jgi:hypothetical protein
LAEESLDGFRSVSKFPAPGALSRARMWLLELAPESLSMFDNWASLANLCDTGWLMPLRRPAYSHSATARVARRRLRVLASLPLTFSAFTALRSGDGPAHLRGTCAALPHHDPTVPLWHVEAQDDPGEGRVLIEEGRDFLLSVDGGGPIYVLSNGGHLAGAAPVRAGDEVSVFGFADEVPDRWGLASAPHGRGGLLPAIRSGSELPLLVTHVVR